MPGVQGVPRSGDVADDDARRGRRCRRRGTTRRRGGPSRGTSTIWTLSAREWSAGSEPDRLVEVDDVEAGRELGRVEVVEVEHLVDTAQVLGQQEPVGQGVDDLVTRRHRVRGGAVEDADRDAVAVAAGAGEQVQLRGPQHVEGAEHQTTTTTVNGGDRDRAGDLDAGPGTDAGTGGTRALRPGRHAARGRSAHSCS